MLLSKSTRTVTDFDELAVRRQAAALRARFIRSYSASAWNVLRRQFSRHAPHGAADARDFRIPHRRWFTELSAGSWTTTP